MTVRGEREAVEGSRGVENDAPEGAVMVRVLDEESMDWRRTACWEGEKGEKRKGEKKERTHAREARSKMTLPRSVTVALFAWRHQYEAAVVFEAFLAQFNLVRRDRRQSFDGVDEEL